MSSRTADSGERKPRTSEVPEAAAPSRLNPLVLSWRLNRLVETVDAHLLRWIQKLERHRQAALIREHYAGRVEFVPDCAVADEALDARWSTARGAPVRMTVVVTTYRRPEVLEVLLGSLRCQTLRNFEVRVIHDGPDPGTRALVEKLRPGFGGALDYAETPVRTNDFGHSLREAGIAAAGTEFVLVTNDDNYYAPRFAEFVFSAIDRHRLDVALVDMIHSHRDASGAGTGSYRLLDTLPMHSRADIGCVVVRTALARAAGFRDKSFAGDGTFIEDVLGAAPRVRVGKLNRALFVHN